MGDGERWRLAIASAAQVSRRELAAAVERLVCLGRNRLVRSLPWRWLGIAGTLVDVAMFVSNPTCCGRVRELHVVGDGGSSNCPTTFCSLPALREHNPPSQHLLSIDRLSHDAAAISAGWCPSPTSWNRMPGRRTFECARHRRSDLMRSRLRFGIFERRRGVADAKDGRLCD
jgi:hypothetical protein